ncbi:MAG: response regulator transcription factor [Solirubrobacterales bacterium]|nr:response regulator transcription factor [Solirubrobacterales bacterium]HRV59314.1 response regulator transcription factor [Solirubrobacterales bacterium]
MSDAEKPGGTGADDAGAGGRVRVAIVDDHAIFRAGVRSELVAGVEVVGEADGVADAGLLIARTRPDVVLLDVHMPDGGGVEVIRRAAEAAAADPEASPAPRFLALSVSDDPEDVVSVIRAGARGYVTKSISGPDLIDAIGRVDQGDAVFSPQLAGFVLDAFAGATAPEEDNELDLLTPREQEVLRLIARGYMYKEIARRLGISVKTVEAHTSSTLRKLQLSSRHELARWATERDLLD